MTNINLNNLIKEAKMWNTQINNLTAAIPTISEPYIKEKYLDLIAETTRILAPLKAKLDYYQIFYTDTISTEISNVIVHELDLHLPGDIDTYIENLYPDTEHIIVSCRTGRTIEELTNTPHYNYSV